MEPKRRAWFQIHLSTAIVLMAVAGLFVWQNLKTQWSDGFYEQAYYGWPKMSYGTEAIRPSAPDGLFSDMIKPSAGVNVSGSATNLFVALASLFSAGLLVEIAIAFRKSGRHVFRHAAGFFQIRLITALVLVLLSSLLILPNITIATSIEIWPHDSDDEESYARSAFSAWTGWPCKIGLGGHWSGNTRKYILKDRDKFKDRWVGKTVFSLTWDHVTDWRDEFALNVVLNLSILIFVASTCEFFLRRREARAP